MMGQTNPPSSVTSFFHAYTPSSVCRKSRSLGLVPVANPTPTRTSYLSNNLLVFSDSIDQHAPHRPHHSNGHH